MKPKPKYATTSEAIVDITSQLEEVAKHNGRSVVEHFAYVEGNANLSDEDDEFHTLYNLLHYLKR